MKITVIYVMCSLNKEHVPVSRHNRTKVAIDLLLRCKMFFQKRVPMSEILEHHASLAPMDSEAKQRKEGRSKNAHTYKT